MIDLSVRFYGGCLDKVQAALPRAKVNVDPFVGASILLSIEAGAIGAAAALCADLSKPALDRAETIVVIGATAPWAEREECMCEGKALFGPCPHAGIPLGPLEPLRAAAEMARAGEECPIHLGDADGCDGEPMFCSGGRTYPLRLVIACTPDDGVCPSPGCGGRGWHYGPGFSRPKCERCSGSGKALSSANVARELLRAPNGADVRYSEGRQGTIARIGRLHVVSFQSSADLDEHGLTAAFKIVTEGV